MPLTSRVQRAMDAFWRRFLPAEPYGFVGGNYKNATMTLKRVLNVRRLAREFAAGKTTLKSKPIKLVIEATNVCNLNCTACFTGLGENGRVRSSISLDFYRQVLNELGDTLHEIEFYNWGEPFLCKSIFTMIEEASRRGIYTEISTNFSVPFDESKAELLVKSGLSSLGVSLDGATQENYQKYRRGGNLDRVLKNAMMVIDAKRRLNSPTPNIIWSFHVFDHNVEEVDTARAMAASMGFDEFWPSKGFTYGDEWSDERYKYFFSHYTPIRCGYLWNYAVIHTDGGVSGCCGAFYKEDDLGRLSTAPGAPGAKSFAEVWNNEKFQAVRGLFASKLDDITPSCGGLCDECPQTKTYAAGLRHVEAGNPPETFEPSYTPNDGHKYFYGRKPARDTRKVLRPERDELQSSF